MESMPFTGTDEIHMRAPTCKYADSKSGFNDMVGIEIRYRQGNLAVFFLFWGFCGILASLPSPWGKAYDTGYAFLSFVFMPARVLLLLAIPQSRFPVCKADFSLRSK